MIARSRQIVFLSAVLMFSLCSLSAQSHKHKKKKVKNKTPSINQTMTTSPGSIQAGRDVHVSYGRQQRKLSADQRAQLIAILNSERSRSGPIRVTSVFGDSESNVFANDITEALEAAGWSVRETSQSAFTSVPIGLMIYFHSRATAQLHGAILQRALWAVGLNPPCSSYEFLSPDLIELVVGKQP